MESQRQQQQQQSEEDPSVENTSASPEDQLLFDAIYSQHQQQSQEDANDRGSKPSPAEQPRLETNDSQQPQQRQEDAGNAFFDPALFRYASAPMDITQMQQMSPMVDVQFQEDASDKKLDPSPSKRLNFEVNGFQQPQRPQQPREHARDANLDPSLREYAHSLPNHLQAHQMPQTASVQYQVGSGCGNLQQQYFQFGPNYFSGPASAYHVNHALPQQMVPGPVHQQRPHMTQQAPTSVRQRVRSGTVPAELPRAMPPCPPRRPVSQPTNMAGVQKSKQKTPHLICVCGHCGYHGSQPHRCNFIPQHQTERDNAAVQGQTADVATRDARYDQEDLQMQGLGRLANDAARKILPNIERRKAEDALNRRNAARELQRKRDEVDTIDGAVEDVMSYVMSIESSTNSVVAVENSETAQTGVGALHSGMEASSESTKQASAMAQDEAASRPGSTSSDSEGSPSLS